jgi:hypothetical protein
MDYGSGASIAPRVVNRYSPQQTVKFRQKGGEFAGSDVREVFVQKFPHLHEVR